MVPMVANGWISMVPTWDTLRQLTLLFRPSPWLLANLLTSPPRNNSQKSAKIQTFPLRVAILNYPKSSDHFRHPWYQKTTNPESEYPSGMIFTISKNAKNKKKSHSRPPWTLSSAPRSQPQNWSSSCKFQPVFPFFIVFVAISCANTVC